jgi:DNA processing protein
MQTDLVGGSMHTVRFALLQGRLLAAPVPQGAHGAAPKSRGILALTQRTGADLARLLDARGAYAELLERKFADRPVALPLTRREDFPALLEALESEVKALEVTLEGRLSSRRATVCEVAAAQLSFEATG